MERRRRGAAPRDLLLLLLAAGVASAASTPIRGLRPELADQYRPETGTFTCSDGKRIPFAAVNDNWCDCVDGSDEPGTSACANGVFYCRNRGHEPKLMSTAFVDDGICDCCDGSDELEGCKNTCIEKNAAMREGLKQKVEDYKRALDKRREYAERSAGKLQHMRERLGTIDADIAAAEQEAAKLEAEKKRLEETADERKAARIAKRKAEEAEAAAKKKEEEAAAAKAAAEAAAAEKEAAEGAAAKAAAEAEEAAAAAGGEAKEESAEERGRRIAAQWTSDPEAAGKKKEAAAAFEDAPADEAGAKAGDKPAEGSEAGGGWLSSTWKKLKDAVIKPSGDGAASPGDDPDADKDWDPQTCEEPTCYESEAPKEGADGGSGDSGSHWRDEYDEELTTARSSHQSAVDRAASLRRQKELLTRQVTFDYGADDAWLALTDHCSSAREPQYTYKVCLFDSAEQIDNGAGHKTSLGYWKGFEKGYTVGVFENGDGCGAHPARSMRVEFQCGEAERAFEASEPSVCAYAAAFATPAACKESDLKILEDRLEALLKEEEALAREIAEEEEARRAAFKAAAAEAAKDEL